MALVWLSCYTAALLHTVLFCSMFTELKRHTTALFLERRSNKNIHIFRSGVAWEAAPVLPSLCWFSHLCNRGTGQMEAGVSSPVEGSRQSCRGRGAWLIPGTHSEVGTGINTIFSGMCWPASVLSSCPGNFSFKLTRCREMAAAWKGIFSPPRSFTVFLQQTVQACKVGEKKRTLCFIWLCPKTPFTAF